MKKVLSFALMALAMGFVFVSCDDEKNGGEEAAKSYTLSYSLNKPNSFYLSDDSTNSVGYYFRDDITIDPFVLVHGWSPKYGFGGGFTYSNCTDDTTATNSNLSAITKKGVKNNTYFISYTGTEDWGLPVEITFKDGKAYQAKECYVTNSTSAYLAIKEGKDEQGSCKEWTKDDKFTLVITGFNGKEQTGKIEFLLADGLDVVNTWQQVDLSKLGKVTMIKFSLTTTDMVTYDGSTYYPSTPFYFCLDQLTVTE
jgi:hypothetical protein